MDTQLDFTFQPDASEVNMIVGWRQWADAGSVSSGLPQYLVAQTKARKIGQMSSDGFYIFQVPGTHDLMRPMVKFKEGYPVYLESQENLFYYTGDAQRGVVIFLGDEPQLDIERYSRTLLAAAQTLRVKRIVGVGGVYGEVPYDKERIITTHYSRHALKAELENLALSLSGYQGGASIDSVVCRRAGDRDMEYVGMYALVPFYDFSENSQPEHMIRLENDYKAWLGVMRRINFMLKTGFDLLDLEKKSRRQLKVIEGKIDELETANPSLNVREYIQHLSENFTEVPFSPLDDVWEKNLGQLLDTLDDSSDPGDIPDE